MGRVAYTLRSLAAVASRQDKSCPYCGNGNTALVQRKHVLWHLRKCPECFLMFRWPKADMAAGNRFYQNAYREGPTTDVPDARELAHLQSIGFGTSALDYGTRIEIVRAYARGRRVLDYGASWGYGVWQFAAAGFDASGVEVGGRRAAFGRSALGVRIDMRSDDLPSASIDVIHTAHVSIGSEVGPRIGIQ